MERLKAFIEHPVINLIIAIVLISTSLAEGWESFSSNLPDIHVGAHHGEKITHVDSEHLLAARRS